MGVQNPGVPALLGPESRSASGPSAGTARRVLVVDDIADNRDVTADVLREEGFEVDTAHDGAEALRLAGQAPDLIVLDVNLPDIDGFEVCRRLKAAPATASIPVLHLSGTYIAIADRVRALDDGADAYLTKPVTNAELVATVRALLRTRTSDAPGARAKDAARALADVGRQLAGPLDPVQAAQGLTSTLRRLFNVRRAAFYELDRSAGTLRCTAASDHVDPGTWLGRTVRIGEDVTGRAAIDGRPVIVHDVTTDRAIALDEEFRDRLRQAGYGLVVAAPVVARDETLGVLTVLDGRGRTFSDDDLKLLTAFADQAALALQNVRLYREARRQLDATRGLLAVSATLGASLDPEELARRGCREVTKLLGADTSIFVALEEDQATATVVAGYHVPKVLRSRDRRFGLTSLPPMLRTTLRTQRAMTSENAVADARLNEWPGTTLAVRPRAVLYAPVVGGRRAIGALVAYWWTQARAFGDEDRELALGVGNQLALALDNARLHAETEARRREAEVLAEVARTVNASLDLDAVLERVVKAARDLCGCDTARIAIRDPDAEEFVVLDPLRGGGGRALAVEPAKGLSGRVLLTGKAVRAGDHAGDTQLAADDLGAVLEDGAAAVMVVPIWIEGRIDGLLYVANTRARPFTDRDESVVTRLAEHAAIALKNARLYRRARARLARMRRLAEVSHLVASTLDARRATDSITAAALDLLDCDVAELWVTSADTLALEVAVQKRRPDAAGAAPPGAALGGRLVRRAMDEKSVFHSTRGSGPTGSAEPAFTSQVAVPLLVGAVAVGGLTVLSREYRKYSDEDTDLLETLAAKAAAAVDHERLAAEAQRAQERLLQSQKIEAIGKLAGGVAHDFNNILTVIDGRSRLMLRRLSPGDPLYRDTELIHESAQRAAALTRQLLAFSRRQVLKPEVVDLNVVVARMSALLERLIGEHIRFRLEPDVTATPVKADPTQLEQVVLNLVVNARDAMPEGGRLTLRTETVTLPADNHDTGPALDPGTYVLLTVTDTGCGMDAEVRARIFEPFFTTKEVGTGTGLGLSTVYGIVEQSGGSIVVDSEPGQGSAFRVYLPRVIGAVAADMPDGEAAEPPNGSETVLLVEDDPDVRSLARELLEDSGFTVLEAAHGREALARCEAHRGRLDLVISDVVMPEMSGHELVARLRKRRPGTKILLMSGYAEAARSPRDPAITLLRKPFTPDALTRIVRGVLDGATTVAPDPRG